MAQTQKAAIQKELVERATGKGKEPTWDKEPTKLQLVKALTFYSTIVDPVKIKQYAVAWAKKYRPDAVALFEAQPEFKFQTYGALMRLVTRGLTLSPKHIQSIETFADGLTMPIVDETSVKPKRKKKIMTQSENLNYRTFCDALDNAVGMNTFKAPTFTKNKEHSAAPVVDVCNRELEALKDDPTLYPEHMKKWFRSVLKIMSDEPAANAPTAKIKKQAKPAKDTPERAKVDKLLDIGAGLPKTAKPAKVAKAKPVKVVKVVEPKATVTVDHVLNGKTAAFLFDERYGRLTQLSATKEGFLVQGKTIKNIDLSKSKVALLKDFTQITAAAAGMDINFAEQMLKCVKKGAPIEVSTRLNEKVLVLKAA